MPHANPPAAVSASRPRVFLSAEWRYLAMVNYEIDPALLQPYVPAGTELDSFQGRTFVSMVGFLFLDARIFGLPMPFHRNFEEVNLRFYVRRRDPTAESGWRRGAVFIREIVPRLAIAQTARIFYNEQYFARRMSHRLDAPPALPVVAEYRWKADWGLRQVAQRQSGRQKAEGRGITGEESAGKRDWDSLRVEAEGEPAAIADGSEEEFITEHYWGYTRQRDGGTVEFEVEHPRWRVWRATSYQFDCDIAATYGAAFLPCLSAPASSAFLAEGSPITVRWGRRIQP